MKTPAFLLVCLLGSKLFAADLIFPQFVNGNANRTRLIFTNNSAAFNHGTVWFFKSGGAELEVPFHGVGVTNLAYSIPPWGTMDIISDGTGPLEVGTVEVESSPGLQGTVIYELLGHRVSVPPSTPARLHRIYTSVTQAESTGVALYNPDRAEATFLRLALVDNLGVEKATRILDLPAHTQLVRFVDQPDFFGDFLNAQQIPFTGTFTVEVTSGPVIAATGLIQDTLTGALVSLPSASAGFPSVSGKQIVDAAGNPLRLRGMNLGGWLVPEGYIVKVPGYGSPTSIRERIEDLLGPTETAAFYQKFQANYVTERDIERIASWGFNSVRLPFNYKSVYDTATQEFSPAGFEVLSTLIGWCRKHRLYVVLDMHCAPGGQNKDNISDSDGVAARLWTPAEGPANQDLTVHIWKEIARRYANEPWVLGYDLLNEPVMPSSAADRNAPLRSLYVRLATEIRKVDPFHILFIEGSSYATDFSSLEPPFDSNMVYSFHKYWNETNQASIQSYLDLRNRTSVPIWLGESGENSNPWFHETVQLMEENSIDWCWWTLKKVDTITSPLSAPLSAEYQRVIDYWNGTASRPSLEEARTGIMSMADAIALDNCVFRPDVVQALIDPGFGVARSPLKELQIPGIIDAVDYDLGTDGVSYHDAVSERTQYENWTAWNMGWQLRNDGVDIEKCSDPQGAAYDIGWIEDGEWVSFTVKASQAGALGADIRVACPGGGGVVRLLWDGQSVGPDITVPPTGGWQTWTSVPVPNIAITPGLHVVKLLAVVGGFNFNRIRFRGND